MSVLIVAPSGREAAACGPGTLICGGGAAAGRRVDSHLAGAGLDALIVAGACGGLDPSLSSGSLVLGRRVLAPGEPELVPQAALFEAARRRLRAHGVPFVSSAILSVTRPVGTRREKTELWNTYGAAAVDLESYAIARAAAAHNVAWLILRAVLDPAGSGLPAGVLDWQGEADERAIVRRLARRPADWPAYCRLALELRRALAALRQGVPLVVAAVSSAPAGAGAASAGAGAAPSESRLAILK